MRWDLRVGIHRKTVHAGTSGSREDRAFPGIAKTRAEAAYFLPGVFATGEALLDRSR
jgi:hypothetical protein